MSKKFVYAVKNIPTDNGIINKNEVGIILGKDINNYKIHFINKNIIIHLKKEKFQIFDPFTEK